MMLGTMMMGDDRMCVFSNRLVRYAIAVEGTLVSTSAFLVCRIRLTGV